ncbi:MAG: hypothetical protein CO183_02000 [Candidatus Zambryskibacteria bacterium CG_4_9_14_3_um_filter_42_9]|uniref:Lipoprotein SmpA/OmlA domain-containing protein n=1 Tax=Candidatus Zambryskibacteria bacterium CG22_combo_CG10-13_8_21_14_all_42_17 TaxID=1975118 RepID=A0A2H0BDR9_9BACT|nr:MAG: hypothetical protein COX06_01515 [Candidatus Zambryskibacteria bacterium CG22_combo_CG10-13_8_21_14_all_42_17]PJA36759.1 MAG: hypothetical protein CO183_02000 [Candidatus Zambryskibacteria bacterium CG_4_9_14_3_um_filter_42_9]
MRILSVFIVLLTGFFLQGCLGAMQLIPGVVAVATGATQSAFESSKPEGKKVSEDELFELLKPGMSKKEVNAVLKRKPASVFPYAEGTMAVYNYNIQKHKFNVIPALGKNEIGSQTVTVLFDMNEKYVRHTFSEMKMCGSGFSGISQENCEKEEQQAVAN